MRTRDVLRWNFAPWDMLVVAGIALAGFGLGVAEMTVDVLERAVDRWSMRKAHAIPRGGRVGPPEVAARTGASEPQGMRGYETRISKRGPVQ